jgi:hypothetical protein
VHDGLEPDEGQDPPDLVVAPAAVGEAFQDGEVVHELERGEAAVESRLLREVAEAPADLLPMARGRSGVAEDLEPPAVGGEHRRDHAQQGGLAGAVRAEEPGDAGLEVERDPGDGSERAEALLESVDVNGGGHGSSEDEQASRDRSGEVGVIGTSGRAG